MLSILTLNKKKKLDFSASTAFTVEKQNILIINYDKKPIIPLIFLTFILSFGNRENL